MPTVQLEYPSDLTVNGLAFGPLAERIEANLDEVGIKVELVPGPVATTLENYRAGKEQMGLWLWNPDYPDPQDYLVFGPGQLVGLRAGWAEGAAPDIEAVAQQAATTRRRRRRGLRCTSSSSSSSTSPARSSRCSSRRRRWCR